MRLAEVFTRKKKAFIAYITAGDPTVAATERFLKTIENAGADIVELGVPHSDPVADGPTNAKASTRALLNGTSLRHVLDLAARARDNGSSVPLVLFTYFNPILQFGVEAFAAAAAASGIDGVLVVDLPPEEACEYIAAMRVRKVDTIFLASPTTDPARLSLIGEASTGFLYYVSRTGVTGTQSTVSASLAQELETIGAKVNIPVCVGFGISTPEQVKAVAALADGVVVGSALVKLIEESASVEEAEQKLSREVARLVAPLREEK